MFLYSKRSSRPVVMRFIAGALIAVHVLTLSQVQVWAADNSTPRLSAERPVSAEVAERKAQAAPPLKVKINTTLPAEVQAAAAAVSEPGFSRQPAEREFALFRVFAEPLLPAGGTTSGAENRLLADALLAYRSSPDAEHLGPLMEFVAKYPKSPWRVTLETNMGLVYREAGYWTNALTLWHSAWSLGKNEQEPEIKLIVDRALAQLAELLARLGRVDELSALIAEAGTRDVRGPATEKFAQAKQSLYLEQTDEEKSFRCGPFAVGRMASTPGQPLPPAVFASKSTRQGTSLLQNREFASRLGLALRMAKRSPEGQPVVPSVVHWKQGHYAAITEKRGERYLIQDPTFGNEILITRKALDLESSGYCLIPDGPLSAGWQPVDEETAAKVWGKGSVSPNGDPPPPCTTPGLKPCVACVGMAQYDVDPARINLLLRDTPLSYSPPRGRAVDFTANYSSRDTSGSASPKSSNLGPKWSLNAVSYIEDGAFRFPLLQSPPGTPSPPVDPNRNESGISYSPVVKIYGPGGGIWSFVIPDDDIATSLPEPHTHAVLSRSGIRIYTLTFPDGSKRIYSSPGVGYDSLPRADLEASYDRAGNVISYFYNPSRRLSAVQDTLGQVTTFGYLSEDSAAAAYYKITNITDPFGRSCSFAYNASGQLWKITDPVGIVSEFSYNDGDFIGKLTTPYGDTTFVKTDTGSDRQLDITDPTGATERVVFRYNVGAAVPDNGAALPSAGGFNVTGVNWEYRNTFYWDKKAFSKDGVNYREAVLMHWLHTADGMSMSDIMESTKAPLEGRVFFNYPGQVTGIYPSIYQGSSSRPTKIARVLDDGSTQLTENQYTSSGALATTVTPGDSVTPSRTTIIGHAANGIDVTGIYQVRTGGQSALGGGSDRLATMTYNTRHLPLTATDASGYTTSYSYNSFGQIHTVTNAKNEVTTFTYDRDQDSDGETDGYLISVTGPNPAASAGLQYDGFGRLWKTTDSQGYTITTEYDAIGGVPTNTLNRPSKTVFADGTYCEVIFDKLDGEWIRDRAGRWSRNSVDANRRLIAVQDPMGRLTQYGWCDCGSLASLTDPEGHQTSWFRDLQGRVTYKLFADNSLTQYGYEPLSGRLKSVTDAKGQQTSYSYNIDGSVSAVGYSGSAVPTPGFSLTYDPAYPRVLSLTDGTGQTVYAYNPVTVPALQGTGRLASIDGPWANDTISYGYDELGRLTNHSINGASNPATVHYDNLGRVTDTTNLLGTFTPAYVGASGQVDYLDYPNSQRVDFNYYGNVAAAGTGNGDRRLQQIRNLGPGAGGTGAVISQFDYAYDLAGQITDWTQNNSAAAAAQHYGIGYDAAGQLTSATLQSVTGGATIQQEEFGFDRIGNRNLEQPGQTPSHSSYNELNQLTGKSAGGALRVRGTLNEPSALTIERLSGPGGAVTNSSRATVEPASNAFQGSVDVQTGANTLRLRAKDASGNETQKTVSVNVPVGTPVTYRYDLNGNTIEVKENGVITRTYEWDGADRMVAINDVAAGKRTELSYDGQGRRVKIVEKTGANVVSEKRFVWSGLTLAEERDAANTVTKRFFGLGEWRTGGVKLFYLRDHLGSVREMTDNTGAVRARYSYSLWGARSKLSGDLDSDFGFTGHYYHAASGLHLAPFRAYDSRAARWLSRDPIKEQGGANLYGYAFGDPINLVDPDGAAPTLPTPTQPGTYLNSPGGGGRIVGPTSLSLADAATLVFIFGGAGVAGLGLTVPMLGPGNLIVCSTDPNAGAPPGISPDQEPSPAPPAPLPSTSGAGAWGGGGRWLNRGSTVNPAKGRFPPQDVREQAAIASVLSTPGIGTMLPLNMGDPRWKAIDGWVKMQVIINGINVHYVYNTITFEIDDPKIAK